MAEPVVNREQTEAWDGVEGAHWAKNADRYDALSQRLLARLMDAAAVDAPERVLDVGCGCGATTRVAARAATAGEAVGIDLSAEMLREAERRARAEGLTNVRFEQADAQVHSFEPERFDVAISRFGVMFFEDPVAAFANVASALRPGGRTVFLCWQDLFSNAWLSVPVGAALAHVPPPDLGPEGAPGPFSLANADRIRAVLTQAGFESVDAVAVEERVYLGRSAVDAADFLSGTGMGRRLLEEVDANTRAQAVAAMRAAFEPHEGPDGVWLDAAAWSVSATRP